MLRVNNIICMMQITIENIINNNYSASMFEVVITIPAAELKLLVVPSDRLTIFEGHYICGRSTSALGEDLPKGGANVSSELPLCMADQQLMRLTPTMITLLASGAAMRWLPSNLLSLTLT